MIDFINQAWFYVGIIATISIFLVRLILRVSKVFDAVKNQQNIIERVTALETKHGLHEHRSFVLETTISQTSASVDRVSIETDKQWDAIKRLEDRTFNMKK